jgi:hypothetical protein
MGKIEGVERQVIGYTLDVSKHVSEYKALSIDPVQGIIHLRFGVKKSVRINDVLITIHNSDFDGPLYLHTLQNWYALFNPGKELKYTP